MKTFDGYKKQALTDVYALLAGGGHKPLSEFSMAHTHPYLPLSGGTITGNIILKGGTSADMTYTGNIHPYIRFDNSDSSQNISLIFTDYDSYRRPAGIKLVGNQGNEWFEATNIYATTFYGTLSGNATTATKLTSSAGNAALPIYFSDGKPVACTASSLFSNLSNSGNNISITIAGQNRTLQVGYSSNSDKVDNRHAISTTPNTGIIYKAAIYTSSSLTSYWVRLASIPSISQNSEFIATIHVQSGHSNPGRSAILLVYLRGSASSFMSKSFKICCNSNYDPNRFRLYYKDSDKTSEIWYQTTGQWDGIVTTVISQSSEGSLYEGLTLYSGSITVVQTPSMSTYLSAQVSTITDNISGNASTATKLQNARQINGTNFDGTSNITTSYWGTTRTLTIGNSGKSVNGSTNISWSLSEIGAASSSHTHTYLRGHRLGYRHLDAGPKSSWSDSRLYIGYNGFDDDDGVTNSIGFYRSTGTGTYTRTLWAEINSNGLWANNRFGVNGQNTEYNFYVNGTSLLNNVVRIQYNTPNLYIRNTIDTSYSIIRFGTNSNENASYIFQNGPSRTDDGGANTMTIRNNVGYLRLDNATFITGLLTVSSGSTHKGIKIGNNYINAINGELIIQNNTAIRFGDDSWDYNVWAGLKYNSSNKTIYLGLADKTIFSANSAQSGGSLRFPGISIVYAPTFSGNLSGNASTASSAGYASSSGNADTLDGQHANAFAAASHSHPYLPLSGGTMTGQIIGNNKGGSWILGRSNAVIYQPRTTTDDWHPVVGFKTKTGSWEFGSVGDDFATFSWGSDSNYSSGTNVTTIVHLRTISGTIALTSDIPTKSSWNYDDRYYTRTESDNRFVNVTGDTITGTIYFKNMQSGKDAGIDCTLGSRRMLFGIGTSGNAGMWESNKGWIMGMDTSNNVFIHGNADSATNADKLDGYHASSFALSGHTHNYDNVYSKLGHTHDDRYYTESEVNNLLSNKLNISNFNWTNLSGKLVAGNEFNIVNDGFNTSMWFNHSPINDRSKTASINGYHFGNGAGGYTSIKASGFIKNGSSDSYVLLGGGGHKAVSDFATSGHNHDNRYVASVSISGNNLRINKNGVNTDLTIPYAINADKLDGKHASAFALSSHTHSYLPLAGGTMSADARISYNSDGNLYIGNSSNDGWVYVQDMASQNGTTYWNITQAGSATFKGTVTAPTFSGNATTATTASKLGSSSVGSDTRHFYLNAGTATASAATVGGTAKPMYLKSGVMTAISVTVGSASKPVYFNGGTITACSSSLTDYLPLKGGSLSGDLYVTNSATPSIWARYSRSTAIRVCASSSATHIQVGNFAWTANVPLYISGPNTNEGSTLYLKFSTVNASGNIQASHFYENSDIRYKRILKNLSINSNTIANLPLFDFEWIENNTIGTGTSAQAVQQILPNLVSGTDKLTLDYGVLGTIAGITACKELVTQKSELQQLKEKVKQLEDKLRKYENI